MPTQEQPWRHKPRSETVLNHEELNSFPEITTKLKIAEDLVKSVGKKKTSIHKSVRNVWKRTRNPDSVIKYLDLKISKLKVECENRKAEGKSLHKKQNREWTTCYYELSTEYLWQNFSEEDLKAFLEKREAPHPIPRFCFKFCDGKFLSKFPEINREYWMRLRQGTHKLGFRSLIEQALLKQGPQDPSSRQTGDLPTPSNHGLGLLATAASNAQLLHAMDPRQESDIPDSDNDGRGASESESLCSSVGDDPGKGPPSSGSGERPHQSAFPYLEFHELTDSGSEDEVRLTRPLSATGGRRAAPRDSVDARAAAAAGGGAAAATGAAGGSAAATAAPQSSVTALRGSAFLESLCSSDDPGKDPPSSGSGERPRQSAFACSGRSKGDPLLARFKRSMIERYREIPGLIDSSSEDEAAAPQSSVTASRGSAAAGADAGGVGGAQAGGVAGAQASGTEGELTFTESLPLCLSRLTAARADWQPPPICQCRSID